MMKKGETLDLEQRLLRYVRKRAGCWEWTGAKDSGGYGQLRYLGVNHLVHRVAWLVWRGPLKKGLDVCHSCDNPVCVNPAHLWVGTAKDNIRDSVAKKRNYHAAKTHCPHGHEYAGDNLRVGTQGGGRWRKRVCRECERIRQRVA